MRSVQVCFKVQKEISTEQFILTFSHPFRCTRSKKMIRYKSGHFIFSKPIPETGQGISAFILFFVVS